MKKKICIILALGLTFSLSGCGKTEEQPLMPSSVSINESATEYETVRVSDEESDAEPDYSDIEEIIGIDLPEEALAYTTGQEISLDPSWQYADFSAIHDGSAVMYMATENRKDIIIGVNAGHGTSGGESAKTYSHPDQSPKTTGGTTAAGSVKSTAVSGGMTFSDGTSERSVTLKMAQILRDKLLAEGYDVLMVRNGEDVQLDNIARTVICNNVADCHIALHWDGDGLDYDKGCFYISVPDGIKDMEPVASHWQEHNALGEALVAGLSNQGAKIYSGGSMSIDLTQTSYSTIPSVDMELGNQSSDHSDGVLDNLADGLVAGVQAYFDSAER